jgi:alpha,alpha-trehalase
MSEAKITLPRHFDRLRPLVVRPAEGFIKHDYLVPGGFYKEQWDWDGFFIGAHFAMRQPSEPVYLKNWALNFIAAADGEGRVPGCVTIKGPELGHRAFQMKPFLAQGAYFAAAYLHDFAWLKPHYEQLKKVIARREAVNFDAGYGLFCWESAMQSGADNNPALTNDPNDRFAILALDMSAFQLREYRALAHIAAQLQQPGDAAAFTAKAKALATAIQSHLWCEADESYWNIARRTGERVRRVSYSNFIPLWANLAPQGQGQAMIRRYLWNKEHMLSPFGLRSLSRQDAAYNNAPIITPCSNWQGPIWPIANYFYFHALLNYGFKAEARQLADTIAKLLIADIESSGAMHENYDAETGAPLAPPNGGFLGWNLLAENMLADAATGQNPLAL